MTGPLRFPSPRAAYIHVPFCRHRCGYCNFTLIAGRDDLVSDYLQALAVELSWLETPRPVDTLFIGGGTPTHLTVEQLRQLCETVRYWFPVEEGHEFSVEANPLDFTVDKAQLLAEYGVNRVSLGVQSFAADKLALLERDHRRDDIVRAYEAARRCGAAVSLDLIFGAPGETPQSWQHDLEAALALGPDHLSTYGLTFERGTSFWSRLQKDELRPVAEDDERWMYETAIDRLTASGFEHYEVSNFARPGRRCRHNETYWSGAGYYAAGPGAARYVAGRREINHRSTTTYLRRVLGGLSPVADAEELDPEDSARERLVFGLRRMEGWHRDEFVAATGFDLEQLAGPALTRFIDAGLLDETDRRIRLTRRGLLISDSLWPALLSR